MTRIEMFTTKHRSGFCFSRGAVGSVAWNIVDWAGRV
jgi:hypothetical protein